MNRYNVTDIKNWRAKVRTGDEILLSGTVYTARDAAHKRFMKLIDDNKPLPFDIGGAVIYYAGPTPARENMPIGSCGPTTSSRMDVYTPKLIELGLAASIGKGMRDKNVVESMVKHHVLYFCAVGGAGALAAKCVKSLEVVAFDDLGCESVKRLEIADFPLIVGIDTDGNNIFNR